MLVQNTCSESMEVVKDKESCVFGFNFIRSRHQVSNLTWDDGLAHQAEQWAIHMATNKQFVHSTFEDENGNRYGEVLYVDGGELKNCHDAILLFYE